MAKKTNTKKETPAAKPAKSKRSSKKQSVKSGSSFWAFFKNEKVHRIFGSSLVVASIYLFIAFISYLINWKGDYSVVYQISTAFWSSILDSDVLVYNVTGKLGAYLSYVFIYKWFGVPAFIGVIISAIVGLRLALKKSFPWMNRILFRSTLALLWFSVTLSFFFPEVLGASLGGFFGLAVSNWLTSLIGNFGTALFLFFTLMLYLGIAYNFPYSYISKQLKIQEQRKAEEQARRVEKSGDLYNTEEYAVDDDEEDLIVKKRRTSNKKNNGGSPLESEQSQVSKASTPDETILFEDKTTPSPDRPSDKVDSEVEQVVSFELNGPQNNNSSPKNKPQERIELEIKTTPEESEDHSSEEEPASENKEEKEHYGIDTPYDPRLDLRDYQFPTTDLLQAHGNAQVEVKRDELEANKKRIVETLNNYNIKIERIGATIGPTITLYEIVPAPGVRISKIKNLEDDIALSLSALGIRIIAPIPGKGTIGIEVPNSKAEIVSMRTVLESDRFKNSKFDLPIALGKTISNQTYVADLAKMPHLLMAGATGQGKSVGLNAIIASLLYSKHPSELKFVMVDPKKVELTLFSKIERHYLAKLPDSEEAIITDTRKVVKTLNSLVIEMDNRYELLKDAQVRNIKEYNPKFIARKLNPEHGHCFMPYIVLVVDEFADLMMTAGKEVEAPITRLAQLARAVGIHLIIATQRPSVNIITGTIKANFPARIAFRVTSRIDSRTILDAGGADQLIGRGDMLLSTGSELIRLQCAFVDTPEVDVITDFIGSQRAYPEAFLLPEVEEEESAGANKNFDSEERDSLFEDSALILVQTQQGSTSLLQRKLKIGYNRAGRIIDQLEAAGVVGPFEGSKAREVRIGSEMALEQFLSDLNGGKSNHSV